MRVFQGRYNIDDGARNRLALRAIVDEVVSGSNQVSKARYGFQFPPTTIGIEGLARKIGITPSSRMLKRTAVPFTLPHPVRDIQVDIARHHDLHPDCKLTRLR